MINELAPQNNNQNTVISARESGEPDQQSDPSRPWPWIYLVAASCIIFSPFLLSEHSFVLAWTQDSPVNWSAQATIFYLGIIALIPFIHALAAAQALGTSGSATKEDQGLSRQISGKALSLVSIGILVGILYALFSLNGLQERYSEPSYCGLSRTQLDILGISRHAA